MKKKKFLGYVAVCGISFPHPRIEPGPLAVIAASPNHWTTRKFPKKFLIALGCQTKPMYGLHSGQQCTASAVIIV